MMEDIQNDDPGDDDITDEVMPSESLPEISFHAMEGTTHTQTIRMVGKLKNRDITVLIDGGSMHNFIDQAVVTKFELPIVCDKTFQVMVANREKIDCSGKCMALTFVIQGYPI